ncbi:M48 family metallopeptidase [Atopobium fossor]|uniref:M48 family metallopeptidase n=1 Tax=Atopobium fossor TaxID=39487 RepID=UPI00041D3286|nr:SprT family zinc-dependent metalloprotease [Atopobium fossor]
MRKFYNSRTVLYSYTFQLNSIVVLIQFKYIKNITLRVKSDGSVVVSAPAYTSSKYVESYIQSKHTWIMAKRNAMLAKTGMYPITNQQVYLWGEKHSTKLHKQELESLYKQQLLTALPKVITTTQDICQVQAKEWRVRNMSSRWGSCIPNKKRIWLSTHLAAYPPECLTYVAIHELCHLYEANHSAQFYALLDRFYPDWKRCKQLLKQPLYPTF